jgi:hypothetical protein
LASPKPDDLSWLIGALKHDQRRWFVAGGLELAFDIDEVLFHPIMEAALDTPPSWCCAFVRPCVYAFGIDRVRRFLEQIRHCGTDLQKRRVEHALYQAESKAISLNSWYRCFDASRLPK